MSEHRDLTLYRKAGRRYVPAHDTAACDGLPNGAWLVVVEDGRRSCCRAVDDGPVVAALAARRRLADLIAERLRTHSDYVRGRCGVPLTARERRAYQAYADVMGPGSMAWFTRPAAQTVADAVAADLVAMVGKDREGDI